MNEAQKYIARPGLAADIARGRMLRAKEVACADYAQTTRDAMLEAARVFGDHGTPDLAADLSRAVAAHRDAMTRLRGAMEAT